MGTSQRALVIGASGQVGRALLASWARRGGTAVGTYASRGGPGLLRLDLASEQELRAVAREARPEVVFLCGAMTRVDACEDDPARAAAINARPAAVLGELGLRTVYVSTEYVFDGEAGPYDELAPTHPVSVYGRTKLEGERAVLGASPANLVVRTTVVYGYEPQGKNFLMQLMGSLGRGEAMRVPSDQVSSPTHAEDLAEATVELALRGRGGVWNVAGPEVLARDAFARRAARVLGLDERLIQPVTTSALGQRARRPLRAGLLTGKLVGELGPGMRGVEAGVAAVRDAARAGGAR